jgi:actin-related protein
MHYAYSVAPHAGMDQCGIAEAIVASIEKAPSEIRRVLYSNILIIGGSCLFSGFRERLYVLRVIIFATKQPN